MTPKFKILFEQTHLILPPALLFDLYGREFTSNLSINTCIWEWGLSLSSTSFLNLVLDGFFLRSTCSWVCNFDLICFLGSVKYLTMSQDFLPTIRLSKCFRQSHQNCMYFRVEYCIYQVTISVSFYSSHFLLVTDPSCLHNYSNLTHSIKIKT